MARSARDTRPALTARTVKALEYSLRELDAMRPVLTDQVEAGIREKIDLENLELTIAYLSRLITWKQRRGHQPGKGRRPGKGREYDEMPLEDIPVVGDPVAVSTRQTWT